MCGAMSLYTGLNLFCKHGKCTLLGFPIRAFVFLPLRPRMDRIEQSNVSANINRPINRSIRE